MVHDSRQVVLGLRVEKVVSEADTVNCHPPALAITQPPAVAPAATEFDVTSSFLRAENFQTRDELIKWVRARGVKLQFAIVIVNSDYGDGKRKQKLLLGCERGGAYKRTSKKLKFEETGTRKCGCSFKLRGYFLASKEWKLTVVNGTHNHDFDRELDAHLVCGRLKPKEMKVVAELTRNLVPPRNIMTTLKERDPDNTTNKKQLYNACHRLRAKSGGPRSEMQHLFHCLEEKNYVFKSRSESDSKLVQDLFFAHPTSVALFNTFPSVFLMDSTYKTNRYGRPLFEMVGCTSTGNTLNVAFAIIKNEKIDNFTWTLKHCRSLLISPDLGPKVTVTDRDAALMNAVETVFPNPSPIVCRYHVLKNVVGKCKTLCKTRDGDEVSHSELVQGIMDRFEAVLEPQTEECYVQSLLHVTSL